MPRASSAKRSPLASSPEVREFVAAYRDCGGLMTVSQAARLLGVHAGCVSGHTRSGRLSSRVVLGLKMIPASEVFAFYREKVAGNVSPGRYPKGVVVPTAAEGADAAWNEALSI